MSAAVEIANALRAVRSKIITAVKNSKFPNREVTLVAVSKTKPVEALKAAYDAGQRHFGENYVQEIIEKAPQLPDDIKWHFIGHLQSNKAKALVNGVKNLYCVETVDRLKVAQELEKAVVAAGRTQPLNIMVQVNTSGEESKSGCEPKDCVGLVKSVIQDFSHLKFIGLMTIGRPGDVTDFERLVECKQNVCKALNLSENDVQLSMGMSGDFEKAIEYGSTSVRVGSLIFGERDYSQKTTVSTTATTPAADTK